MAYTTDRTWVTGEIVTAAYLNTYLRDNMSYLYTYGFSHSQSATNSGSTRVNSTSYANLSPSVSFTFEKRRADTYLIVEAGANGLTPASAGGGNSTYVLGMGDGSTDYEVCRAVVHDDGFENQSVNGVLTITGVAAGSITCTLRQKLTGTGNGYGPTAGSYYLKVTETVAA